MFKRRLFFVLFFTQQWESAYVKHAAHSSI